jgi:hypothetical protein
MKRYKVFLPLMIAVGIGSAQTVPSATVLQQYSFAPLGVAAGQTMRLSLANAAGGSSVCIANLSFINSDGTSLKNQDVTVKAGQTASFSLLTGDISSAGAEIRGLVKLDRQVGGVVSGPGMPAPAVCLAVMSLEVVDAATGQTRVVLTNPTVIAGLFTGAFGQVPGAVRVGPQ